MNVLQICDFAAVYRGNFIESLDMLDSKLGDEGGKNVYMFPPRIITRNPQWFGELSDRATVYIYENGFFGKIKGFKKVIKEENIDIIATHFTDMATDLCIDLACAESKCIKVKHYESGVKRKNSIKKFAARIIYSGWNAIGVSESVAKGIEKNTPKCPIECVNNAIFFPRLDTYKPSDPAELFADENAVKCLMFSYDYNLKGADLAIEAISKLRKKYNICLTISTASNSENIRSAVIAQLGEFPRWINLVPGRNDVASYYNACDIFLSPSRSEGFCFAIVEASYCGKAVIASDCPGQFSHGSKYLDIYWFKNGDAADLGNKIEKAIADLGNKERRERNKRLAVKNYSIENWAEKLKKMYADFLNK